jgi:regulator of protease activity HflC (stomatin/prohibitin superfamily)
VPVLQNVRLYDTRIQTLEARDPERFLTSENRNVLVDSFVKWRVVDVSQYYVSVRGDSLAGRGAHLADRERRAARRVRAAHGARRGLRRARDDHERGRRQGGPGRAPHRRRRSWTCA